jgi:hypothetical protein
MHGGAGRAEGLVERGGRWSGGEICTQHATPQCAASSPTQRPPTQPDLPPDPTSHPSPWLRAYVQQRTTLQCAARFFDLPNAAVAVLTEDRPASLPSCPVSGKGSGRCRALGRGAVERAVCVCVCCTVHGAGWGTWDLI